MQNGGIRGSTVRAAQQGHVETWPSSNHGWIVLAMAECLPPQWPIRAWAPCWHRRPRQQVVGATGPCPCHSTQGQQPQFHFRLRAMLHVTVRRPAGPSCMMIMQRFLLPVRESVVTASLSGAPQHCRPGVAPLPRRDGHNGAVLQLIGNEALQVAPPFSPSTRPIEFHHCCPSSFPLILPDGHQMAQMRQLVRRD